MTPTSKKKQRIALITGKLAEPALRRIAEDIACDGDIEPVIITLNIQVAALMTTEWVARKIELPDGEQFDRVILTGYCRGDVRVISDKLGMPVELGPSNLHDLPTWLGRKKTDDDYGKHSIEIIAEINHAASLTIESIIAMADEYIRDGADMIDIGCDPQSDRDPWNGVSDAIRALRERGIRVSIDSFHPVEVEAAAKAGAELVLSVNASNRDAAKDWGMEVVAIPDTPSDTASLDQTIEHLAKHDVSFRVDPIIEPIGFGFANSLVRYHDVRQRYPDVEIMMGIGNLSEMTEADSAGVNMIMLGFCQELRINSVLTTQVINWARSSVREIDIARRVMHYAISRGTPPKHIDERLVMLRDPKQRGLTEEELNELAASLTDPNFRLFAAPESSSAEGCASGNAFGAIHAMNRELHESGTDPFEIFAKLGVTDPSHAFYLGYEMAKAITALTLGKNYEQDEPLRWGPLTRNETTHYENRKKS